MCSSAKSMRVVRGAGMFHVHKAQYSKDTQDLLKVLMEESRLTNLQRKHLQRSIANGDSLPLPRAAHKQDLKPLVQSRPTAVALRPTTNKKRPQEAIIHSGAYERERFVPIHPTVDKLKEKIKFQSLMAYGKELPPTPCGRARRTAMPLRKPSPECERFQELIEEVKDRFKFLMEMKELGQEKKYRPIIEQEIAAKVRQMEAIDKQRCSDLEELMEQCKATAVSGR